MEREAKKEKSIGIGTTTFFYHVSV